jgi:hypothetical protein
MAKIQEQHVVIALSKLKKDSDPDEILLPEEVLTSLEAVVQELVGDNVIVEIAKN